MRSSLREIETEIERLREAPLAPLAHARALLALAEETLEHWIIAHGATPTDTAREGFRLLALHRQGAQGDASFNACRETCREIAYHYNLITAQPASQETTKRLRLMTMVALHLFFFVSGKLENAKLGEFCCSARPLHADATEN